MGAHRALLKVRAFDAGVALPYRSRRHSHVSSRPLVIAYVQMAGEPFTMWGAFVGRSRTAPTWICAPDPRNRDLQAAAFERLALAVNENVTRCLRDDEEPLQVWVSNTTAASSLRRLGRVMRSWQMGDDVARAGALLDVYAQAATTPGCALCIPATKMLSAQRVTGQSEFEDQNLAAQLAWWDRSLLAELDPRISVDDATRMTTFEAARHAEKIPMGTLTDPRVDGKRLEPLVERFNSRKRDELPTEAIEAEINASLQEQVRPIWEAIWVAHREVRKIPEAPSSDDRWADDSRQFRWQIDWLDGGGHRRYADTPMQAAKLLSSWESNQAAMARDMVIDDDLALVEAVLDGKAVIGRVTAFEERKIGRSKHPFITISSPKTDITEGTKVWLRSNVKIAGEIVDVIENSEGAELEIHITAGMRQPVLPKVGEVISFLALDPPFPIRPKMPREAPWTHARRHTEEPEGDGDA